MQRRVNSNIKKPQKDLSLTKSLSARISPLGITQKFTPGSFDLEGVLRKKLYGGKMHFPYKQEQVILRTSASGGQLPVKLSKHHNNHKPDKKQPSTKITFEAKADSTEDLIYLNELRMKLDEVLEENKQIKENLKRSKGTKKKLWRVVKTFRHKLTTKLNGLAHSAR